MYAPLVAMPPLPSISSPSIARYNPSLYLIHKDFKRNVHHGRDKPSSAIRSQNFLENKQSLRFKSQARTTTTSTFSYPSNRPTTLNPSRGKTTPSLAFRSEGEDDASSHHRVCDLSVCSTSKSLYMPPSLADSLSRSIRRVKCDEEKPYCRRCVSTGRKCDGYINAPLPRKGQGPSANARARLQAVTGSQSPPPLATPPSELIFVDERETQCFDFFRQCTVPQTNQWVMADFWSFDMVQMSYTEPAIKDGVLALSALHRHVNSRSEAELQFAMQHYAKAVSQIGYKLSSKHTNALDLNVLLISVVIFHCFENQIGNRKAAAVHLKSGFRMASETHKTEGGESWKARRSQPGVDRVIRTMRRLDVHDVTYLDVAIPYEWDNTWTLATDIPELPSQFEDLDQSRDVLMNLYKTAAHLNAAAFTRSVGQDPGIEVQDANDVRERTLSDLAKRRELQFKMQEVTGPPAPHVAVVTEAYHKLAVMILSVLATKSESTWDVFVSQCTTLIQNIAAVLEKPSGFEQMNMSPFSLEGGIIAPLSMLAMKCRHPVYRRQAISLLESTSRQEGKWESLAAAAVCKAVVQTEEAGLSNVTEASDIPESRRVHHVQPRKDFEKRTVHCTLLSKPDGLEGKWKTVSHTLHY